LKTEDII